MKNLLRVSSSIWVAMLFFLVAETSNARTNGPVTVGKGGTNENCSANSLQDAVNLAKLPQWDDIILVSRDVDENFFDGGTILIDNQNVDIRGGFEDCWTRTEQSGYQVISGQGGSTNSVFTIRGNSNVWLSHLEIIGGDDGANDNGGGIDFNGSGSLNLNHMHILLNQAGYGGGIYASGGVNIEIGDDVLIADNTAIRNGGGIYLVGFGARLNANARGFALHRNSALGVFVNGQIVDGQGGGLYVKMPGSANVFAKSFDGFPVFWDNRARRGGAIATTGADNWNGFANVNLGSHDGTTSMMLDSNTASIEGGAIYVGSYSDSSADSVGAVCASDTILSNNRAPEGAAVYASASDSEQGQFVMQTSCSGNLGALCPPGANCAQVRGNRAQHADGTPTNGAIFEFPGGNGVLRLSRVRFNDNSGGALLHMGDGNGSTLDFNSNLVDHNDFSGYLIDTDANKSRIRHTTIVDNTLGSHVIRLVESANSSTDSLSAITNSIIAQPFQTTLRHEGAINQTTVRFVLASEIASMPLSPDGSVFIGNPAFANLSDYTLGPMSQALDAGYVNIPGEAIDGYQRDLLGRPRTVDLPGYVNQFGGATRDLGCYEMQSFATPPPDQVFLNGFE